MKYFDIHSHLNLSPLSERKEEVIKTLVEKEAGTITVGTDFDTSVTAAAIAMESEHLYASVGLHPTEVMTKHFDIDQFRELASKNKVVAIGECGLDYFRTDDAAEKERQKELFIRHIAYARKKRLPLMIHGRPSRGSMDAYEDILSVLSAHDGTDGAAYAGDVHFFAGTVPVARQFLDGGFSLSFDGPITFTSEYDEVVRYVPAKRIMAETDAPFAAPAPFRGKRADPTHVRYVVQRIAEIRGVSAEAMSRQTVENAVVSFRLDERQA
jgi:TatD DNase family protein